ncbi:MAG: RNA polymerase sigma factor [Ekhidna sp.]
MKNSHQIVEEWLVINCQNGDRKSFELLVKRWNHKMLSRAYHTTKDASAAKDIVQESWVTIIKKIRTLRDAAAFPGWSLKIVTLKSIDWVRANQLSRKREEIRKVAQTEFDDQSKNSNELVINNLKKAIEQLPEDQRSVIHLFYQENLPLTTISQLLSLPIGTIKSRLFRGREHLKKVLEHKLYENETE